MIFPKVKKMICNRYFSFRENNISVSLTETEGLSAECVNTVFPTVSENGNIQLFCSRDETLSAFGEEAYSLTIEENSDILSVRIKAFSDRGFIRGLFTLKRMILKNEFPVGEIEDHPSFAVRGYIEGFYGNPWKSEQRPEMLELMALFGENTHYYAPKDDPYHRNEWRMPYPEKEALQLKALVDKAKKLYMSFYYCIAPGLSMKYSDENEFLALCRKTEQLFSMGITDFGLLLDDIPEELFFEEDKKRYGNAVNAHVELVGKYYSFLKSLSADCRLTVCPTAYHGKGTETKLTSFAKNVPSGVDVFFTGRDICSQEITLAEAEVFYENNLHKPLYWDNYPVNDAEMFMEMHIGPVIGREKELYKGSAGLISNCMEYFNCNKFPLITVAAYLWNPEEYEPEEAYKEALEFLLPENERESFMLLSDQFRTSCLNDENSRIMGEYLASASVNFQTGNYDGAVMTVKEYAHKIRKAAALFRCSDSPLYKELERWLKKFYLMSEILDVSVEVLEGADKRDELSCLMEKYNESATVLTAFCFREYIESVLNNDQG